LSRLLCRLGWVIHTAWQGVGCGRPVYEALGMGGVGGGQHLSAGLVELSGVAVVDRLRGHHRDPRVAMRWVVPAEELLAEHPGVWIEPNRAGTPGRYGNVVTWLWEYGLSLETWGGSGSW